MINFSKYRTIHSISEGERKALIKIARELTPFNTFMDFGCHLGHVSIHFAVEFNVTVFAVDNFTGTKGDKLMEGTINEITDGKGNFFMNFIRNVEEARQLSGGFKGTIIPVHIASFEELCKGVILDFVYIDASHLSEDACQFKQISDMIRTGGLLAYHDAGTLGVDEGIDSIKKDYSIVNNSPINVLRKVG